MDVTCSVTAAPLVSPIRPWILRGTHHLITVSHVLQLQVNALPEETVGACPMLHNMQRLTYWLAHLHDT